MLKFYSLSHMFHCTHTSPCVSSLPQGEPCDLKRFGQHLRNNYVPNTAIIDCTASDVPASNYLGWMNQGIHIITPNKKLGSGPLEQYKAVRKIQVRARRMPWHLNAVCTVFLYPPGAFDLLRLCTVI